MNVRGRFLGKAEILTGIISLAFIALLVLSMEGSFSIAKPYLLLPLFGLTLAIVVPAVFEILRKGFDPFTPIMYATLSYLIPTFIIGSLYLTVTEYDPWVLRFIPSPEDTIPLTMAYLAVGVAFVSVGYQLSMGRRIATRFARWLPDWRWQPERLVIPALLLLSAGLAFKAYGFIIGIEGYQITDQAPVTGGLVWSLAQLTSFAAYFLWLVVFRRIVRRPLRIFLTILLLCLIPITALIMGSRSSVLHGIVPLAVAYWGSGRRVTKKGVIGFALVAVVGLIIGMLYGTMFRSLKGGETRVGMREYYSLAQLTVGTMSSRDLGENLVFAYENLMWRLEVVSSMAVFVANYEHMQALEAQYKIDNNIWTSTWAAFVPRFIWKDKPLVSDARSFGALYFNFGGNSFAISPMVDLLRNFGPLGVPVGMLFLGIIYCALYYLFWVPRHQHPWNSAVYCLLLDQISFEAFYATILSDIVRILIVALLAGLFFKVWLTLFERRPAPQNFWNKA